MTSKLDYPKRHAGLFRPMAEVVPPPKPARKTKPKPPPKTKGKRHAAR